ncbi:MAG TPA: glycine cleavage system aminomethyltransferase GcvT [Candidatus Thermoplasmatota archaeon]|jgi:aminomethyltransferase|nr:glycine cleavage system aminomethyltransferase GcvT [Candidatus Thermoplasmatota archaeon]
MADLLRTPLHALHQELGGQMVPFAGYDMPVRYTSIQEEHMAVRTAAGLFDVSHMSNLWVRGQRAGEALAQVTVANAPAIPPFGTKYTTLLRDDGTIIDDLYIYRLPEAFHLVPNAGMNREVAAWIADRTKVEVQDKTDKTCIFALQGPRAAEILQSLTDIDLKGVKRFRCALGAIADVWMMISRTGYTGEDGFELFPESKHGEEVFRKLLDAGRPRGLKPCGLGARDTLRLEKGFCLAGHEFAGGRTPLEASLDRFVAWDHDFVGKAALEAQRARQHQRLVGLAVQDRGIPRQACEVHVQGKTVGAVTSGTMSPVLKKGIALAYVDPPHHNAGTTLDIMIRGAASPAVVVPIPFVP